VQHAHAAGSRPVDRGQTMRGKATRRLAAAAVVFSVIAAGCGGLGKVHPDAPRATAAVTHHQCDSASGCPVTPQAPAGSSTTPSTPAPSVVVRSCSVAPAALVGAVLGVPTTGPQQFDLGRGVIQCLYASQIDKPAVLRFYNNVDAASFATLEVAASGHGQAVTNIRFQDQAFTSTSTGRGLTLTVLYGRRGSLVISVVSSASLGAEETLETQIFATLSHH
jgi:hypothetical protein